MDPKTKARHEVRAKVIKAMGHPTRRFIVDELSRKERCVCELTEMIGAAARTHVSNMVSPGRIGSWRTTAVGFHHRPLFSREKGSHVA